MAINVQIVLQETVKNLGKPGSIVKVRPGYARNFLIPRGLAVPASANNVQRIEHEQKLALARAAKLKGEAEAVAQQLANVVVEIAKTVGEEDKLYGSVTSREVADALAQKGYAVDRKKIELPESVRSVGEYECKVRLGSEVTTTFKLRVTAKSN